MRNQKGITLIALVITIIVLLILAGVSIAMLTGNNGILSNARRAQTQTVTKSNEEVLKLGISDCITDFYADSANVGATLTLDKTALKASITGVSSDYSGVTVDDYTTNTAYLQVDFTTGETRTYYVLKTTGEITTTAPAAAGTGQSS